MSQLCFLSIACNFYAFVHSRNKCISQSLRGTEAITNFLGSNKESYNVTSEMSIDLYIYIYNVQTATLILSFYLFLKVDTLCYCNSILKMTDTFYVDYLYYNMYCTVTNQVYCIL